MSKGFFCVLGVRVEFFTRQTAAKTFQEQLELTYNVGPVGVVWGFFLLMCTLLCSIFSRLRLPTPSPFSGAFEDFSVFPELEADLYTDECVCICVCLSVYTYVEAGGGGGGLWGGWGLFVLRRLKRFGSPRNCMDCTSALVLLKTDHLFSHLVFHL